MFNTDVYFFFSSPLVCFGNNIWQTCNFIFKLTNK